MIVGIVQGREERIRLTIRGFRGREQNIDAVVDSGYTGWFTLPLSVIAALILPPHGPSIR
jgi:predicted aspartyl protease